MFLAKFVDESTRFLRQVIHHSDLRVATEETENPSDLAEVIFLLSIVFGGSKVSLIDFNQAWECQERLYHPSEVVAADFP